MNFGPMEYHLQDSIISCSRAALCVVSPLVLGRIDHPFWLLETCFTMENHTQWNISKYDTLNTQLSTFEYSSRPHLHVLKVHTKVVCVREQNVFNKIGVNTTAHL